MPSISERSTLLLGALITTGYASYALPRLMRIIQRGNSDPDWRCLLKRPPRVIIQTISLRDIFKSRKCTSTLHAFVACRFLFYVLISRGDVFEVFIPNYEFLGYETLGGVHPLGTEVVSVNVIAAMSLQLLRRFIFQPSSQNVCADIGLYPKAYKGLNSQQKEEENE
ncbi:MAG: hypothetical protein GTO18_03515 [Anaerolineales bacterium]|nr:hypothetical protein [Anaerolineales bacterium]